MGKDSEVKWIINIKDATINLDGSVTACTANNSRCITCGKDMPIIWDTVCAMCGGTLCYDHSTVVDGHWSCTKCLIEESAEHVVYTKGSIMANRP